MNKFTSEKTGGKRCRACLHLRAVLLGHEDEEVKASVRVTPLVIVPRNELNKVVVERDTGSSVKDGRVRVADKVLRDNGVLSVAKDTLELVLGSTLDLGLDLVVAGTLLEADGKVNDRDVGGGDTESHTGELAVERRNNLADGLGGTGGGGDDVGSSGTTSTPVLGGGTVDGLLGGSGSMNRGHETLNNAELVVDDLGKGSKAVGGARGVGDDLSLGIVRVEIDTANIHGSVSRGSRDDDLLGTTLDVGGGLVDGGEDAGGLDNVVGTGLTPGDGSGILLGEDGDLLAVDNELAVLAGDVTLEDTVGGVVLKHVDHVLKVNEGVVDSNNVGVVVNDRVTEDDTSNAAKAVWETMMQFEGRKKEALVF